MSLHFQEHHFRNLERARDGLTNAIISLRSATGRMTGEDWLEAATILRQLEQDIGPRLSVLRTAARDRFVEHTHHPDFEEMRTGRQRYPDERERVPDLAPPPRPPSSTPVPESSEFPNAAIGLQLVTEHGSVDAAMMAYQPDSPEFDHVQAYRYVTTGRRPKGWVPPVVPAVEE